MNQAAEKTTQTTGIPVEVRGLRKSFRGMPVLQGVNFTVKAGEIFSIMGPSGSGKSVLLKHIIGLENPDEGEILIAGERAASECVQDKYRLAMVFQSGALLNSLTVAENVGLYLREHRLKPAEEIAAIVREKLDLVDLEGVEEKFPSELSGGMRKRVAIARALVTEPQLILYDEPTSELDPMVAVVISEEILRLNKRIGVTSIIVTHDRELAFGLSDRIAILFDGRILFSGTPEEVRRHEDPQIQQFINADIKRKNI